MSEICKLKIKNFGPIKNGYSNSHTDDFFNISRCSVIIGEQGTGKSTVAKLVSTLLWLEKYFVQKEQDYSLFTENDFLTLDPIMNETIEKVKNRQTTPDDLFESIDLKLSEEDVSEKILPFIDYCLNDGFESIDNFFNKVSQKYAKVYTDKYSERDRRRCSYTFKWDDYDEFKKLLNKEYKDYLNV